MLRSLGSKRARHDLATEPQQQQQQVVSLSIQKSLCPLRPLGILSPHPLHTGALEARSDLFHLHVNSLHSATSLALSALFFVATLAEDFILSRLLNLSITFLI